MPISRRLLELCTALRCQKADALSFRILHSFHSESYLQVIQSRLLIQDPAIGALEKMIFELLQHLA